jgi:tetratricopeptide (TPR) repeat protein
MKEEAIHQYEIAVHIKDDPAMDTNLGNAYEAVGRYPDAIKIYNHALDLNEANPSTQCNLGYALMQEGKVEEAVPHFMECMELDPTMPQGRTDLTQSLRILGINPDVPAPVTTGSFSFDVQKALDLLKNAPPPDQGQ